MITLLSTENNDSDHCQNNSDHFNVNSDLYLLFLFEFKSVGELLGYLQSLLWLFFLISFSVDYWMSFALNL